MGPGELVVCWIRESSTQQAKPFKAVKTRMFLSFIAGSVRSRHNVTGKGKCLLDLRCGGGPKLFGFAAGPQGVTEEELRNCFMMGHEEYN
jgi:hypothetical protein